ncbi:MAG: LPS assembly lipoprotein LptE [Gemmatimonadota bacterium]
MSGYFQASARLALLLATLAAGACNYGLTGGGGFPPHVRTLYIEPLENETPQFDVDQQILTKLNEELPRALGIRMAGRENADAVLRATVSRYEDAAQNYRPGEPGSIEVLQHQVRITLSVTIVDVIENVVLYESTSVSGTGEYRPDTQNDEVARLRAIEVLVQQIIDGAQSQW